MTCARAEEHGLRGRQAAPPEPGLLAPRCPACSPNFQDQAILKCSLPQALEYAEFDKFDRKRWPQTRFVGMMQVRGSGVGAGTGCWVVHSRRLRCRLG